MERSRSYIATPPGATIKEQITDRGMSQKELAIRMGMSEKHISKLINGEVQLTMDVARKLEMVLGLPTQFWCSLESIYREKMAKVNDENVMDADVEFAEKFPYKEMAQNGWVTDTSKSTEKVVSLRKYFEVAKLSFLQENLIPTSIACRKISEPEKSYYALVAWAQKAKIEGRKIKTRPININKLVENLSEIRKMTVMSPNEFGPQLQAILANCGIAIVFLPHVGGLSLQGTTFLDSDKIILGLMVREKDADQFWFYLFRELGHIILGHIEKVQGTTQEDEHAADVYSENTLIPQKDFDLFVELKNIDEHAIIEFADKEGIDAGIVVSRLQKYGYIKCGGYQHLKKRYDIA